jgi:hypothetical protein
MCLGPPVCIKCVEVYSLEWPSGKWYCAVCGNQETKDYYFTVHKDIRFKLSLKYPGWGDSNELPDKTSYPESS